MSMERETLSVPYTGGYQDTLGYTIKKLDDGRSVVELQLTENHLNQYAVAHGGVPLALLDVAGGACLYNDVEGIKRMATISMNTNFIKGAQLGLLTCVGKIEKGHGSIAFTTMTLHQGDEKGPLLASAQGSYRLFLDEKK